MTARISWSLWSATAELVVVDPSELRIARELADAVLAEVERTCSRHRDDAELRAFEGRDLVDAPVSPVLARLLEDAIDAARRTDGLVDPTLGDRLEVHGFAGAAGVRAAVVHRATWRDVSLHAGRLTAPAGVRFDLGATGKASAADLLVEHLRDDPRIHHGVLVSLGGDLRATGSGPDGGWQIDVRDGAGEPGQQVRLHDGGALATSSTLHRRRLLGEHEVHHILDPRHLGPATDTWRTVSCAAPTCAAANTASTAAIVLGWDAPDWLEARGVPARLVAADRQVLTTSSWPSPVPAEVRHG
ncbi:thiamine biosynthesis protein [Brachybacterium sp. SGAir0954]|uniref:FAD:protein FMN transferase n=1 Tax=Brachybacterium sp. SGAir0954 TaxID=2571029 RepID=UPI0010CD351F|nr:FAD:protein FMN transferase [Brachybacterium sp. SGAir0954]QCR53490.1 thiamine biosynthesis protein [Brachybacterium sp. SGAir0954]